MLLYVQPLNADAAVLTFSLLTLLLLIATVVLDLVHTSNLPRYYSRMFKDIRICSERPTLLNILLSTLAVLLGSASVFASAVLSEEIDKFTYLLFTAILFLFSIAYTWKLAYQKVVGKHSVEHLKVLEVATCENRDNCNVIVLQTGYKKIFTYVSQMGIYWSVGDYYEAKVKGSYIEFISNKPLKWEDVRMYKQYTLRTNSLWYSPLYTVILGVLSAFCLITFYVTSALPFLVFSIDLMLCALLYFPWTRKRKLIPTYLVPTDKFMDVDVVSNYTFILRDRSDRYYYLQTDDVELFESSDTYICECKGNTVKSVICPTDTHFRYSTKTQRTYIEIYIVAFVLGAISAVLYMLDIVIPMALCQSVMTFLLTGAFRYKKRGEGVYGNPYHY